MKQLLLQLICVLLSFLLCFAAFRALCPDAPGTRTEESSAGRENTASTAHPEPKATEPEAQAQASSPVRSYDERFRLPVLCGDKTVSMTLRQYVLGALLGEMPTSFAPEALKAQAVAIRTFSIRQYTARKHGCCAVCTNPGCCMNWVDPDTFSAQNGQAALEKAIEAAASTDGLIATYQGEPIWATFFSCSGGRTENAADVWGGALPYLRAVDSLDEHAPYDEDTLTVSDACFISTLTAANEMAFFSADGTGWIGEFTYTEGGGVDTVELGGCIYTGQQLRKLFDLRSTAFTLAKTEGGVVFTTRGYGHRVGLSQYGANALAEQGWDHLRILQWYYTGVTVEKAG